MSDPNFDTIERWAQGCHRPQMPNLPASDRLALVEAVQNLVLNPTRKGTDDLTLLSDDERQNRLGDLANSAVPFLPTIQSPKERVCISLRVWSGCMEAAKTIATETAEGPVTPEHRAKVFRERINPLCQSDDAYRAGVEIAETFKGKQAVSFDGVPDGSAVMRGKGGGKPK